MNPPLPLSCNHIDGTSQGLMYKNFLVAQFSKFCIFQIFKITSYKKILPKSTCPTGSFTCPRSLSNGTNQALISHFKITATTSWTSWHQCVNSLRPRQKGPHFPDDIFKGIFLNENEWISLKISLKFFPKIRINNIPTLVQIMAWRWPGDKPLSGPIMVSLLTHLCVARPQWVNSLA